MRIVFVHGMRQEGHPAADLLHAWRESLYNTWDSLKLPRPLIEPEMPFYGDVLDRLTARIARRRKRRGRPRRFWNRSFSNRGGNDPRVRRCL